MLQQFLKRHKTLLIITAIAFIIRIIDINWDNGLGLHPDERMIMFVTEKLGWTNLNPNFFNYGNLPIYLLKIVSSFAGIMDTSLTHYPNILYVGRFLSAMFDTGTTLLILLIGTKIFNKRTGFIAGLLYATAVFPIQNAHFYIVDPQMTFWMMATVWILIREKRISSLTFFYAGITAGLSAATKFTGIVTIGLPLLVIIYSYSISSKITLQKSILYCLLTLAAAITVFFAIQPYALIEFPTYIKQVSLQLNMAKDATIFPYTKQFIPSIAYLDPAYGIIWWGLGLPLGILSVLGLLFSTVYAYKKRAMYLSIMLLFFGIYFVVFGQSAVKYMRYYLPLYPLLTLCAAFFLVYIMNVAKQSLKRVYQPLLIFTCTILLVWPLMYLSTLLGPPTRVVASDWIFDNIKSGSTILSEAWDDALPFGNNGTYAINQLNMYDPESATKWNTLSNKLSQGDYLVLSSKRVYRSIILNPSEYPETSSWYIDLFNGRTEYQLIKVFTSYPRIAIGPFSYTIPDNYSPESFTIFDHPKVMIFKNIRKDFDTKFR